MATSALQVSHPVPIGTGATGKRVESDSMGSIEVPAEHYWGAQTQRSLIHFSIGDDHMPKAVYHAYGYVKKAAALVNADAGRLDRELADAIVAAADEVIAGKLDSEFPLYVWQTGSGTQSNMNVNEVIANRASQLLGGELGSQAPGSPQRPRQHGAVVQRHLPDGDAHRHAARDPRAHAPAAGRADRSDLVKGQAVGRRRQDRPHAPAGRRRRSPSGRNGRAGRRSSGTRAAGSSVRSTPCHELAAGGTAVGTGINAPDGFGEEIAAKLAELTGLPLKTAPNKFAAQGSLDAMVAVSAGLRGLAVALMKIANDMRWLASGPRAGLHELKLPANEPGSSIMPGKVNPTQQEAMVMVCLQVIGEDSIVAAAGAQGNFELNAMRPIIINNVLHSARILGDASEKLRRYSIEGTELDQDKVTDYVGRSLMLVTALSPHIGYDKASAIAHKADDEGTTLREAALALGVTAADFDRIVDPKTMVGDPRRDLTPQGKDAGLCPPTPGKSAPPAPPHPPPPLPPRPAFAFRPPTLRSLSRLSFRPFGAAGVGSPPRPIPPCLLPLPPSFGLSGFRSGGRFPRWPPEAPPRRRPGCAASRRPRPRRGWCRGGRRPRSDAGPGRGSVTTAAR